MKLQRILVVALLLLLLASATGLCASSPAVVPVNGTHALLVHSGEQALLIGGEDEQAVESALSGEIQGVVKLCDDAEHSGAVDALAAHYGVPVISQGTDIPMTGASWQGQALVVEIDGVRYMFGADASQADAIAYRCDGSLFPYSGKTNESAVNIREKTNTKSGKVGRLQRGDLLTITGIVQNENGEYWYSVQLPNGAQGYIRSDLIVSAIGESVPVPEEPQSSGTRYIGNKKSKVFHLPSCGSLPSGKNQVYADSRSYFIAKGYKPCQNCNP